MKFILMLSIASLSVFADTASTSLGNNDIPANAEPGQCFAKVITPAQYDVKTENVMLRPETTTYKTVAPVYSLVNEKVTVEGEKKILKVIPATYKFVEEKVLVKEAGKKLLKTQPVYKTVSKKIMVKPETKVWKKGEAGALDHSNTDGVLCLVTIPAVYKTVKETVMDVPAGVTEMVIPAKYRMIKKKVVDTPARVEEVIIPAVTKTIKVNKLIEPARKVANTMPAKFRQVQKRVLLSPSKTEWSRILCKTNSNSSNVVKVQKALKSAGINPGKIDGILGSDTARAIKKFQKMNGLSVGALTYDTINKLNVSL